MVELFSLIDLRFIFLIKYEEGYLKSPMYEIKPQNHVIFQKDLLTCAVGRNNGQGISFVVRKTTFLNFASYYGN